MRSPNTDCDAQLRVEMRREIRALQQRAFRHLEMICFRETLLKQFRARAPFDGRDYAFFQEIVQFSRYNPEPADAESELYAEGRAGIRPLLLRVAYAERRAGRDVAERIDVLGYRLQLALDGLETTHAREAAYFALYLLDRPEAALDSALANWAVQHEPIDARLVLEAALAAGRPAAARPIIEWLDTNRIEHVDLQRLAAQVRSAP